MAEKKTQLKIEVSVKDQATKAFETMGAAVKRFGGGALASIAGFAAKFTGLGALLSGAGLASFVKSSIELAQAVEDLAGAFGTTIESMSAVVAASKAYGIETETLTTQLKTYAQVVEDAATGNKKAQQTLQRLGVTAADLEGAGGDLVAQLAQVADGFGRLDGSAAKATLATQMFGRQGIKMLELLGDGSEKFKGIIGDAERFGAVLTREGAKKAAEVEAEMAKLDLRFQGMGNKLSQNLVPALKKAALGLLDFLTVESKAAETFERIEGGTSMAEILAKRGAGSPIRSFAEVFEDQERRDNALMARLAAAGVGSEKIIDQSLRLEEQVYARSAQLRERKRRESFIDRDREIRQVQELAAHSVISKEQEFRAIESLKEEHVRRMRELDGSILEGLEDGLAEVADKWTDFYAQGKQAAVDLANGLQAAFLAASDAIIQDIKNIEGAWKAFRDVFIRVLADMIAKLLSAQAVGFVFSLFTGGGGGVPGATTPGQPGGGPKIPAPRGGGGGGGGGSGPESLGLGGGVGSGAGTTNNNVTVVINKDAKSFSQDIAAHRKQIQEAVLEGVTKGTNRNLRLEIGRQR